MGKPDKQQERTERYHKEFAAQLIEQVKKGTAPWQKPWKVGERIGSRNLASGQLYSGSNTIRLMVVAADRGYSDSRWATYGQIQAAGDQIRKGERGTHILSFKTIAALPSKTSKANPSRIKTGSKSTGTRNCPALSPASIPSSTSSRRATSSLSRGRNRPRPGRLTNGRRRLSTPLASPSSTSRETAPTTRSAATRLSFPKRASFHPPTTTTRRRCTSWATPAAIPAASTATPSSRAIKDGFGSEAYAREELRAEISAMMTGDRLGTGHDPSRGAAYVSSWVEVLDKNPQEIVNASAEAQRMSNYLISRTQERPQDQGEKTQDAPGQPPHEGRTQDRQQDQGEKTQDAAVPRQQQEPPLPCCPETRLRKTGVLRAKPIPKKNCPPTLSGTSATSLKRTRRLSAFARTWRGPPTIEEAKQRAASREQTQEPGRQYRTVPVPHRPGVYRIQDAKDPSQPVPKPYGTMYAGKAEAEKAIAKGSSRTRSAAHRPAESRPRAAGRRSRGKV